MRNFLANSSANPDFLAAMLAASPDCVKLLTADGIVEFMNSRGVELNELDSEADVIGKNFADMWPEQERPKIASAIAAAAAGTVSRAEGFCPTAKGAPRWWEVRLAPFSPPGHAEPMIVGISRDVTETVLARQAEAARVEVTRTWQVSPDLLSIIAADGSFESVNPSWTTAMGWSESELLGAPYESFLHPDDVESSRAVFAAAVERGEAALHFENRYRRKDGGYLLLSWLGVPDGGKVFCTARDITEARASADSLRIAEEALRQSQKMEAIGQLTGGLAHDFNNLLTGITGGLELVRRRVADGRVGEVERHITASLGAAKRAAALTHRLLAFSRRQTLSPKPLGMNRQVLEMEDLIRRTIGPGIELDVVAGVGLWTVMADASQLENALLNLCINARDAMPEGGKLSIETANRRIDERVARDRGVPPGQYVSLSVSDNGVGMPPDVAAHAFEPFFTTKPIGLGTGLGLSMIYGFAQQSGGQARIYSEVGQGTMVSIYLPRHIGQEETQGDADTKSLDAPPRAQLGETVLIVDDEPTVRTFVAEVMAELGYATIEASDGSEALKALESPARVDLLISDVGLPGGMNGRQVADAGRSRRPGLKVLFITGYAENAVLSHGHLDPGMHVMTKPFEFDHLARMAKDLIQQR